MSLQGLEWKDQMERVMEVMNLSIPVPVTKDTEVGPFDGSYGNLINTLKKIQAEIKLELENTLSQL